MNIQTTFFCMAVLLVCGGASYGSVTDTFSRHDNASLGTTEGEQTMAWTKLLGQSSVQGEALVLRTAANSVNSVVLLGEKHAPYLVKDFTMTMSVAVDSDSFENWFSVYFRAEDPSSTSAVSKSYNLQIRHDGTLTLYDRGGSGVLKVAKIPTGDSPHVLKITAQKADIKVYWDEILIIDVTDKSPLGTGGVKLWAFQADKTNAAKVVTYIDNFTLNVAP